MGSIQGRIIPTCVGKRRTVPPPRLGWPDHPHVRGEKRLLRLCHRPGIGSSPRAWGKGPGPRRMRSHVRIIPTCVGKRAMEENKEYGEEDHPHVRGEKETLNLVMDYAAGSSPRAWGKGYGGEQGIRRRRIIPTCVGKSSPRCRAPPAGPDHPHVRGEKFL